MKHERKPIGHYLKVSLVVTVPMVLGICLGNFLDGVQSSDFEEMLKTAVFFIALNLILFGLVVAYRAEQDWRNPD